MNEFGVLELSGCGLSEILYDSEGKIKGYTAEISFKTYIDRDFSWLQDTGKKLELSAQHIINEYLN